MSGKERRLRLSSRAAALTKECDSGANLITPSCLCLGSCAQSSPFSQVCLSLMNFRH